MSFFDRWKMNAIDISTKTIQTKDGPIEITTTDDEREELKRQYRKINPKQRFKATKPSASLVDVIRRPPEITAPANNIERKRSPLSLLSAALLWMLSIFFLLVAISFFPSLTSLLLLLCIVLILPIQKWQRFLNQFTPKRWIKPVVAVILTFMAVGFTPSSPSTQHDSDKLASTLPPAATTPQVSHLPGSATPSATVKPSTSPATDAPIYETALPEPSAPAIVIPPEDSTFEVHFIDVGQADAALVLCDGHSMLIDGGNANDSSLIYTYLKNNKVSNLDYIICSHAHEDHVGGLSGALNYATVDTAFCSTTSDDSKAFSSFVKYLNKQDVSLTIPNAGDQFLLGSATVTFIGPVETGSDPNNSSLVVRIVYGDTSFLFTGDAESEEEQSILNSSTALGSTVLKVGHHGSDDSTTYPFLREVMPKYAVISVGEGNSYGHPAENTLIRLRDADVSVYRTDLQGDIVCISDGKKVSFSVERNADADTLAPPAPINRNTETPVSTPDPEPTSAVGEPVGTTYILNKNTKKFHYPSCGSVKKMKESNKLSFTGTRDEVIAKGYKPCGNCHP